MRISILSLTACFVLLLVPPLVNATPVRLTDEKPVSITQVDSGVFVVDFGRVAFGNVRLLPSSDAKGEIVVHFGEDFAKGQINRKPPGTVRYAKAKITINDARPVVVAPKRDERNTQQNKPKTPPAILTPKDWGVVLPFRWLEIEGWEGKLLPEQVTRQAAYASDWDDDAAAFESSDEMLNQIWELCRYSIKATTFAGVYVDGDRERIPYEADAYLNQLSHYYCDNDIQMARDTFDHLMKHGTWPTEWAPHMVFMAYADWMRTGDVDWLTARYESLKSKMLLERVGDDGLVQSNAAQVKKTDIVDWPRGERDGYVFTSTNTVVNAFHLKAMNMMAQMARGIGRVDDAKAYEVEGKETHQVLQRQLFDAKGNLYRDGVGTDHHSLHANLFPLAFGLAPDQHRDSIASWLAKRGMKCSVYAAQYLMEAMFENGADTQAIDLMTAKNDRSWRHMVQSGTTITWEAWDQKYKPNQDWNHAWGAAPANLLPRYILGVEAKTAGWEVARIRPCAADLKYAKGKVPTPLGPIVVDWKNENDRFELSVALPAGMSAQIEMPASDRSTGVQCEGQSVKATRIGDRWVLDEQVQGTATWKVRHSTLAKADVELDAANPAQTVVDLVKDPAAERSFTRSTTKIPPNIVVILADDLGFSDLGCYGAEHIRTPNLDRLAAEGLRYTNFYNSARCWPTRMSLMTGYQDQQLSLHRSPVPCVPHYLAPLGYKSYHSGKWHLHGTKPVQHGGFEHSYWLQDHNRFFKPESGGVLIDDQPVADPDSEYVTRAVVDHSIKFLTEHQRSSPDAPFFLYLAPTAPHFPLQAEPADIDLFRDQFLEGWDSIRVKRNENLKKLGIMDVPLPELNPDVVPKWSLSAEKLRSGIGPGEGVKAVDWDTLDADTQRFQATKMAIHAAMIYRLDQEIGRLVDYLKETRQYNNTLLLFLSDNGATAEQIIRGDGHDKTAPLGSQATYLALGPGWASAANTPFRYYKHWTHEGGAATPFIAHWPAGILEKNVLRKNQQGHVVDILPTLVAVAGGGDVKPLNVNAPAFSGISLLPSFTKNQTVPPEFIYLNHSGNTGLIQGDWKVVKTPYSSDEQWELYNLKEDRNELHDRASRYPQRLQAMTAQWEQLTRKYQADRAAWSSIGKRKLKSNHRVAKSPVVLKDGRLRFTGSQVQKLKDVPMLDAGSHVHWEMEVNITPACGPGAVLMGNRHTPGRNGTFLKITPSRGVQFFKDGKEQLRINAVLPRNRTVKVELIKNGPLFQLVVDGKRVGSAKSDSSIPAMPCYLGGDPSVDEFATGTIGSVSVHVE